MLTSPFSNGTIFENDVSQITESSDDIGSMLSFPKYNSQSLLTNVWSKFRFSKTALLLTQLCLQNIAMVGT